jgi:protein-glucosylgalactosylhydroxylysine glucosidase
MNAVLFAEAGDVPAAARFAAQCHDEFVHGPFLVWSEGSGGWGVANFVTGAAGFLETLLFGWPRLRIDDEGLSLRPLLPPGSARVTLR